MERKLWKTHVIWHKNWNYPRQILEVLLDNYWIQNITCGKQVCLQVIILYTYYTCNYTDNLCHLMINTYLEHQLS